jgi:hypothetical protein
MFLSFHLYPIRRPNLICAGVVGIIRIPVFGLDMSDYLYDEMKQRIKGTESERIRNLKGDLE